MLGGRHTELAELREVIDAARTGRGAALLIEGVAGIGKTALVDALLAELDPIDEYRIVRAAGAEAERTMTLAGVTQLCAPLLAHTAELPPHQASLVRGALGLERPDDGEGVGGADVMALGLALLSLLAEAARHRPLVVVLDDAHWLDPSSQQVFAFVGRRLAGTSVALIASQRRQDEGLRLPRTIELRPLPDSDAIAVLVDAGLDPHVAGAVSAHAQGHPLLLTRIVAGLSDAQRTGIAPLPDPLPTGTELEAGFAAIAGQLPTEAATAVLVLAALGVQHELDHVDPLLAKQLLAAEELGLVELGGRSFRFVHPLARSAVYWAAPPGARRAVHARIAEALDADQPAQIWHRAAATTGPDRQLADDLIAAAHESRRRGAGASAVVGFQRAVELAVDDRQRVEALLAAAHAALESGSGRTAELLTSQAGDLGAPEDDLLELQAEIALLAGKLSKARSLTARLSERLRAVDPDRADAAAVAGSALALRMSDVAEAERLLATVCRPRAAAGDPVERHARVLRTVLAARRHDPAAADRLPEEIAAIRSGRPTTADLRFLAETVAFSLGWLGHRGALLELADDLHRRFGGRLPSIVPSLLVARATCLSRIDLAGTAAAARQAVELADELGLAGLRHLAIPWLATAQAGLGDEAVLTTAVEVAAGGTEATMVSSQMALGYYALSCERFEDAFDVLFPLHEWSAGGLRSALFWQADLAEAALRTGRRDVAEAQAEMLDRFARTTKSTWLSAAHARVAAQLATDLDQAVGWFERSTELFTESDYPIARARALLMWGERLRRGRRRSAARERLLEARAGFDGAGMSVWVERCERELAAAGAQPANSARRAHAVLTPQELQVARWIVAGESNREVATRMFLSPRTVEAHLSTIYRKLAVRGRSELAALAHDDASLSPGWVDARRASAAS